MTDPGNNGEQPGEAEIVPPYLQEEEPTGIVNKIKYHLLKGKTREELEQDPFNFNPGSIRDCVHELVKDKLMEKPARKVKVTKEKVPAQQTGKAMQIFAKGAPPEAIIESISVPIADGEAETFEQGMKFGMSTVVLGVRVAQELASIGGQQAKPILDMARAMREGEAMAAKGAADEAAYKAASSIQQTFGPMIASIQESSKIGAGGADPMKAMMVRTMEPLMKGLLGRLVPGMSDQPPTGWTKKTE